MRKGYGLIAGAPAGIGDEELEELIRKDLPENLEDLHKILLLPPDITRLYSCGGRITAIFWRLLHKTCQVDIMPALGTHQAMTEEEALRFFGPEVPYSAIIRHDWRQDTERIGTVPADFVRMVSEGTMQEEIPVEVNRRLLDPSYDRIYSIGQVVPHEIVGMANYSKNIFVGCGGPAMIGASHMLGAVYGLERIMGKDHSPVRQVFDYAEEHFLQGIPLTYILTVTTQQKDDAILHGIYIGRNRKQFEDAVALSQKCNLTYVKEPFDKVVAWLDPREFRSTWIGNKAIYRTRRAIRTGGELIILAPGVDKFGEDPGNDRLIRKYGYHGRDFVLKAMQENKDLQENLSGAAHLIHGSTDGRFRITYCTSKLSEEEVRGVGFGYEPYDEAAERYHLKDLKDGYNTLPSGEKIFFISNPALGLWVCENL